MAYIIAGENAASVEAELSRINYNYNYPNGLDLKPGSKLHTKLRTRIWQRAQEAQKEMSKCYDSWRNIDKIMTAYMPVDDAEKKIQDKDSRKPVSIVFPYSYSMLEALLTYMTMAFFQDPMFQYEGVEDNDTVGAMLLEMVIRLHTIKTKVPLTIHTAIRDGLGYGIGIAVPTWETIHGKKPVKSTVVTADQFGNESTETIVTFVDSVLFEGNALSSIDPYLWLPDPSVSSVDIQRGEFCGWIEQDNLMNLLTAEQDDDTLFNVKYLKNVKNKLTSLNKSNSSRQIRTGGGSTNYRQSSAVSNAVDTINMYIKIIPSDWELSDSDSPEIWFFRLSSDAVITSCHQANHNHGMFPVAVNSPEFDGYSTTPISRMEILYGLQHVLDFLFNSHIANVRKSINDMLIVDPYLVNINDLRNPKAGALVRLRRPAWGRGVDKVVQQLTVNDITRLNISDSAYITQWMDRISGADQSMQGALRQSGPERLTKGEFQGTRSSAVSRLQRLAMIISMQFMQDIGTMFAVHTQQYMKDDAYVKIIGRYKDELAHIYGNGRARVSPADIAINYDVIVRDGSIPGGNFSEAWLQLFKTIGTTPELMQQFDVTRIFMYIAQQLGAKNVEDFRRITNNTNISNQPDETVLNEAEKGNLVPIGGGVG